jgi:hypothetical protein
MAHDFVPGLRVILADGSPAWWVAALRSNATAPARLMPFPPMPLLPASTQSGGTGQLVAQHG